MGELLKVWIDDLSLIDCLFIAMIGFVVVYIAGWQMGGAITKQKKQHFSGIILFFLGVAIITFSGSVILVPRVDPQSVLWKASSIIGMLGIASGIFNLGVIRRSR